MTTLNTQKRNIGVNFSTTGEAKIRVWSPLSGSVQLVITATDEVIALEKQDFGYWTLNTSALHEGAHYTFSIDGKTGLPDITSLSQPLGTHGPSVALDLLHFPWNDTDWQNIPLEDYIFYELHTGTFTAGGSFIDIEERLNYLVELGITAIELMPVAQFPGKKNWGYDGVFPFAVQHSYGGAPCLQHLVNAAHNKGLAVVLDVVYNHLGPEGNYFSEYGPYFTSKYQTPWGNAINFDDDWSQGVREYFIENALMWFRDFHIDALRLDAVHAIKDCSAVHFLQELRTEVDQLMAVTGMNYYLVAELDLNDTRFITPVNEGGYGIDAQWIDEFHHALRVTAGGDTTGYYEDFEQIHHLAKAYRDVYVYDGQFSRHRKKTFGKKVQDNPGSQFVIFSQNHDHIGNRMLGERTSQLVSFEMQKLMAGSTLLSPFLPLLFMGEEWSETNPFLYFIDHKDPELTEAIRQGRRKEFAAFHVQGEAPDPAAQNSFESSKLQWSLLNVAPHKTMFGFYKELIKLRKNHPALHHLHRDKFQVEENIEQQTILLKRWFEGTELFCVMNFSLVAHSFILPGGEGTEWRQLFNSAECLWGGPEEDTAAIHSHHKNTGEVTISPESFKIYNRKYV